MPTIFENLSDKFYTAFFEPDSEKRKLAIETWIKEATPVIQSAVENDIHVYLEYILKDTWTPEGWKNRAEKFSQPYGKKLFIDSYKLCLDVKLRQREPNHNDFSFDILSPEVRTKTIKAAQVAVPVVKSNETTKKKPISTSNLIDGYDDDNCDTGGHSSNDDRSDSMNPNNDDYHSSMDNHADQMNPNNDSYWSSRGH